MASVLTMKMKNQLFILSPRSLNCWRPYASLEPELSASELMELDALAHKVELDRLQVALRGA